MKPTIVFERQDPFKMGPTIAIQQCKKQMCLISDEIVGRQQFKKMRAYWKTFRLTNLIHYNNYLDYRWRGSRSFLIGQMRDRYQASTNAQFGQSHYKFVSAIPADIYNFTIISFQRGRMVLCTIKILLRIDKAFKTIVFCLPAACSNLHACLHLIYC